MTLAPAATRTLEHLEAGASSARFRLFLFGISDDEACFARRGFHLGDPSTRERLERVGHTLIRGYRAALVHRQLDVLAEELGQVEPEMRGFGFEGAAMALSLLDFVTPWKRDRLFQFVKGPGAEHAYMIHVGVGWSLARLGRSVEGVLKRLDPLLGWLVVDGLGFHEGYFHWPRAIQLRERPRAVHGYAARAFDQGLGRSLWFVECGDPLRIADAIARFDRARQADLWSGVGWAAAYAGGGGRPAYQAIRSASGVFLPHVAQGVAFAAQARSPAQIRAAHTELACAILCGMPAEVAARTTQEALDRLPPDGQEPSYEAWRKRVQLHFTPQSAL